MKTRTLLDRVDASLAICAAAASASLAVVPSSDADIVYSGVVSINIPSTTAGIYLNVVTGVSGTTPAAVPGWDINPFSSTTFSLFNPATPTGGVYVGSSGFFILSLGIPISAASTFSSGTISASSPNPLTFNSPNNIIGFRFQNEAMGNQIQYGWFRVSFSTTPEGQPRAIYDYAYENNGGAIFTPLTPVIPEPNTINLLGLMAVGGLGLRAWRKRTK